MQSYSATDVFTFASSDIGTGPGEDTGPTSFMFQAVDAEDSDLVSAATVAVDVLPDCDDSNPPTQVPDPSFNCVSPTASSAPAPNAGPVTSPTTADGQGSTATVPATTPTTTGTTTPTTTATTTTATTTTATTTTATTTTATTTTATTTTATTTPATAPSGPTAPLTGHRRHP